MPKVNYRLARVAETLQRELALLIHNEIQDPRAIDITLTKVKISADLRHAKIFFTTPVEENGSKATHALNHAVSYLRRRIAQIMQLRVVPQLFFIYDTELRNAEHLTQLIDSAIAADKKSHQDSGTS